jgi:SAM-dependent methyltransferase
VSIVERWIPQQAEWMVGQWEQSIERYYPQHRETWRDPKVYLERFRDAWNIREAYEAIDWNRWLQGSGLQALDLGCGTGWVSAFLSRDSRIASIRAVDSSSHLLTRMVPEVVRGLGGDLDKIHPIQGMFQPLMVDDRSLDLVVCCSSLHHADNLTGLLTEIFRVLKPGGLLAILNELPATMPQYLRAVAVAVVRMFRDIVLKRFAETAPSVSAAGHLYDAYLGDRTFPLWYWQEAIRRAGFSLEHLQTLDMPIQKREPGLPMRHFFCRRP